MFQRIIWGDGSMSTASNLREKLRKIEALFSRAGTEGERSAADAALDRIRARLAEAETEDPVVEMQFSIADQWGRYLFIALCRRYGLKPYRYPRQRRSTVMIRAPRRLFHQVLWHEFCELEHELQVYLHEVTLKLIQEEIYADTSDVQEVATALSAA
jgi:hypothetical protein